MALTASTAFLLLLGLMVSPVFIHSTAAADFNCTILNGNYNENSNFTLNVSSTTFNANQTYTVTVTGSGNVTVVLQAVWNSSNVGTWSAGANSNSNCTGNPVFQDPFQANGPLVANWSSPNQMAKVVINAYIVTDNVTYKNSKELNAAAATVPPTNQTTVAPTNQTTVAPTNQTTVALTNQTKVAPTNQTTVAPAKQTPVAPANQTTAIKATTLKSTGSVKQPGYVFLALIQTLGLLLISSKLLS
ncbi:uncharacterized protein LOC142496924 [Ascaphus truei]|uniref:uncharacterized protein LOC142496924 n=1 Tax=Ascaphus truei TaxID=8439 RepID=UPI003F5ABCA9